MVNAATPRKPVLAPVQAIDDHIDLDNTGIVVRVAANQPAGQAAFGPAYAGPERLADTGLNTAEVADSEFADDEGFGITDTTTVQIADDAEYAGSAPNMGLAADHASPSSSFEAVSAATNASADPQTEARAQVIDAAVPLANSAALQADDEQNASPTMKTVDTPRVTAARVPAAIDQPTAIPIVGTTSREPDHFLPTASSALSAGVDRIASTDQGPVTLDWITPSDVSLGQQIQCQLLVRNTSQMPLHNVRVQATLPKGVQLDSCRPKAIRDAARLVWDLGEIDGGEQRTIELDLTPMAEGQFNPQATVTFSRVTQASIQVLRPQIELALAGPEQIISGQPMVYEFVVSNPGNGRAHNVILEVTLPEQLKHTDGPQLSYAVGTLGPHESRTVQVPLTGAQAGAWEFTVRAQAAGGASATQKSRIEVVRPRLEVNLEGPGLRYVDRPALYTVRIHNPGPAPANNIQVIDAIPAGFRFVDASAGGTYDSTTRQVSWFVGRLEANASAEVGVQLIPTELGEQRLTAEVRADSGVSEQAEAQTRVEGVEAIVLDVIDTDDPVEINGETVYEIRVTNRGTKAAENVQIAAKAAAETEVIDAAGPTPGKISGGQIVFDPIPSLEPGQCELFQVRVICRHSGEVGFKAYFRTARQTKAVVEEELTRIYQD